MWWSSIALWLAETFAGAVWRKFFPSKSNVEKANAIQNKIANESDASVNDQLRSNWTRPGS